METVNTTSKNLPTFLLKPAERILNAALSADPTALAMLRELDGRKITVELTDLSLVTSVAIAGDQIILDDDALVPDAEVSGHLSSLLAAARSGTARGLSVNGDAEMVQGLARAMSRLPGATWERIACTIGDVPARGLERFAHGVLNLVEGTGERIGANLSEYLQYELRAVASRTEVEVFTSEVDTLRSDAERLAKRIERLTRGPL